MDPSTVRRGLERLQAVGLVEVHMQPETAAMKTTTLRMDTALGAAFLAFYRSLADESL
jgi:hypothetical protein